MIACNADGAVVIVISIFVVMRNGHQRGKKEEQCKQCGKSMVYVHGASVSHEHRLNGVARYVKYFKQTHRTVLLTAISFFKKSSRFCPFFSSIFMWLRLKLFLVRDDEIVRR